MKLLLKAIVLLLAVGVFFVGVGLVLTWAPDKPVEALKARWAQPPSQFVPLQGLQVHLRDEGPRGDALPIVLLHGTSASLHTWQGWAEGLRGERRVIRFDLPGFGLTGPNAEHDYSIERYVRFVVAMLDQLGVQRCVLAGNSLGGQIAWSVALAAPQRVEKLVLVDAGGYPRDWSAPGASVPIGFRIAATPSLRWLMEYTLPRGLVERSVRSVYGDPSKVTPELVDLYYDISLRAGNRAALVRRFQQGFAGEHERIKTLTQPTLILWGGQDRLIPPEHGQRFAADIAGSRLVVYPELGHIPHEEDAARTLVDLKRFLKAE